MKKERLGYVLLIVTGVAAVVVLALMSPIAQSETYHNFSDNKTILGIPNFWNVLTNLPFLACGLVGLFSLRAFPQKKIQYVIFFLGIFLVGFGSAYFHWNPNNSTLVWDRLPMTVVFMSLLSIAISEFINERTGRLLLIPLLLLGCLSILYWAMKNDLRLYALVQFYPIIAMPVILLCLRSRYNSARSYWLLFLAYFIAKVFEVYDYQVHEALGFISGHSLKHVAAACGLLMFTFTHPFRSARAIVQK